MNIREHIRQIPEDERLEHALDLLEYLLPKIDDVLTYHFMATYNLTKTEASLLSILYKTRGAPVKMDKILFAFEMLGRDISEGSVRVYMCRLRKILPEDAIITAHGVGFYINPNFKVADIDIDTLKINLDLTNARLPWTEQQDDDLKCMLDSGSDIASMAYELERSERAILERIRYKGLKR